MNTAVKLATAKRLATKNDLDIVSWVVVSNSYADLSALAVRYLALIHSFIQLGFSGIQSPIGAITDLHRRVFGVRSSERSTYRALAELETHGFLRRQTFRIGPQSTSTVIHFLSHSYLHLPKRQTFPTSDDRISYPNRSSVSDTKSLSPIGLQVERSDRGTKKTPATCNTPRLAPNTEPGARHKRSVDRSGERFATWEDPICYSIRRVAPGASLAAHRDLVRSRSKSRFTVIDWAYWSPRWQTLPIAEREQLAIEFSKALLEPARKTDAHNDSVSEFLTARRPTATPPPPPAYKPPEQRPGEAVLDLTEMVILAAARDRARYQKALDCANCAIGSLQKAF